MLIMVMGLPGSGKSYFAKAIAYKISGLHFNSDIIRKQEQQQEHSVYAAKNKFQVYKTMFQQVCLALDEGNIVVVDATFSLQQYRDQYVNYARIHEIPLKVILISANEHTILQRVQRVRPDSDADFEVYKKIKSEFEPINMGYLQLESDQYSLDILIEQGLSYLAANAS